jgi:hypothetical protein
MHCNLPITATCTSSREPHNLDTKKKRKTQRQNIKTTAFAKNTTVNPNICSVPYKLDDNMNNTTAHIKEKEKENKNMIELKHKAWRNRCNARKSEI